MGHLQSGIARVRPVIKTGLARTVAASLAILLVVSGVAGAIRYAGICTLTIDQVFAACPLGFLERSLASRNLLPALWLPVVLVVLSVIALGRVFCSWVCPAGLVRRVFRIRPKPQVKRQSTSGATTWSSYSSYAILGGVLFASFLFQFPVFCLFCPVGLFFASVFGVLKLLSPDPPGVELVLFLALLGLELFALKSWCRSICPLGALLSILGNLNRFLVPVIRKEKCRISEGINCQACQHACPEGIDLRVSKRYTPNSCTKCLECYERCPVKAIKIAVLN